MSWRCVVVEDERPAREKLKRLLAEHPDFTLVGEAADAAEAVRLIDEIEPDLLFLDVQMPEGDGFQVLEQIERMPHVVFTTAHDHYAVRAFEVRSLDYLLKPFSKVRFAEALARARRALERPADPAGKLLALLDEIRRGPAEGEGLPLRISGRRGAKIVLLDPAEVLWIEAEETLVFAKIAGGRFLVERTLADLEQVLGTSFFRSHRRYLVNLRHVAEILPGEAGAHRIVFRDEAKSSVPLSRRQARRLRELIPW